MNTVATMCLLVLAIVLVNVWREGGSYALRSWVSAKLRNKPASAPGRPNRPYAGDATDPRERARAGAEATQPERGRK